LVAHDEQLAFSKGHRPFVGYLRAIIPKAQTAISRMIRRWELHHRSDKAAQDLATKYNPYIQGWINYYGQFYRTQLRPILQRIDADVIRWAEP
jgi:RNA-directed DNA polymerase